VPKPSMVSNRQPTRPSHQLRQDAEARLKQGTAPPTIGWVAGQDALALLFKLASNPETASEALKLLHELQVHQVELDLQQAQLECTELENAHDLSHYAALYEYAPMGYLIVGPEGDIVECNLAGTRILGATAGNVADLPFTELLAPTSRSAFNGLLKRLREGDLEGTCEVQSAGNGNDARPLRITARLTPAGDAILMAICDHH